MTMYCKYIPSLLVSHEETRAEHMKAITRLHPRKTQHHVHNCLNLNSCCGSKWCISTYTSTFNNNIWDVLQMNIWTFFFLVSCEFPWKGEHRLPNLFPYSLPVLPSIMIGLQTPLGQHPQRANIRGPCYQWSS